MKIGYVTREFPPSKRIGGIGVVVSDIARFLAQNGHRVTVICASDDITQASDSVIDGVRVIRLKEADFYIGNHGRINVAIRSHFRRVSHFRPYRKQVADCLETLISQREIDIVEFPEYGNEAEVWSKRKRSIPFVIRLHGPTILDRNTGEKISYLQKPLQTLLGFRELATIRRADAISAVSKAVGDFVAWHSGIPPQNITPIHNGIWSKSWAMDVGTYNDSKDSSVFRVFSAGSVAFQKGYAELVDATRKLRERGHNIELVIAGKLGKLGRYLLDLSQNDQDHRWLKILGAISRNQLADYYAKADLVVFPSWWEPFGTVCVEAMAAKALVLASSAGGWAELITDGNDGFLIAPKDSTKLAEKMDFLLALPENEKRRIRLAAYEKVSSNVDIEIIAEKLLRFYRTVIESFSSSR